MNNNAPCPEWEKQLAALHPDDLTPNERTALESHVALCLPCATTLAEYQRVAKLMREALIIPPPQQAIASNLITNMSISSISRGSYSATANPTDQLNELRPDAPAPALLYPSGPIRHEGLLSLGMMIQEPTGDGYIIESLLGTGGFGAVYLVSDRHNKEHQFALKELTEPSGHNHERLLFECEILKRLDHPALPRVYHVFEQNKLQRVYLLMEYIKGKNLEDLREEQPDKRFPLELALTIMAPIVDALTYLHQKNPPIVHRDIKPGNIIVPMDGDKAVLVDFGTAKEFIQDGTTTVFRHGSPGYAPIEQYSPGSRTNLRTDVYGFGATLYTLLTGMTPINAIARITADNGKDPLLPVNTIVPDIPLAVSNAIQCALSIYNQNRFADVAAFWKALYSDSFELPNQALPASPPDILLPAIFDNKASANSTPLHNRPKSVSLLRNRKVRTLSLVFLILLALGLGTPRIFSSAAYYLTIISVTHSTQTPTPKSTAAPVILPTSDFPQLAQNYAGTIGDSGVARTSTNLYLTKIKQDQHGNISGHFDGLYLVGPFTGTISKSGDLNFTMKITVGFLVGNGAIEVGGELAGSFTVVDPQGNSLGEYGPWSADLVAS